MPNTLSTGPSGHATWRERAVETGEHKTTTLYILPDGSNDTSPPSTPTNAAQSQLFYYLPKTPRLAHDANEDPIFSLTLMLSRQPAANETDIRDLIERGVLSCESTLALSAVVEEALTACAQGEEYRPIFARGATFTLLRTGKEKSQSEGTEDPATDQREIELASSTANGANAQTALNATLNRSDTLALLNALEHRPSALALQVRVPFRTAAQEETICLRGSWAAIYDFLDSSTAPDGTISEQTLRHSFGELFRAGILTASRVAENGAEEAITNPDPDQFFASFLRLATLILQRRVVAGTQESVTYTLGERPHPMFKLDYTETISGAGSRAVTLSVPLHELLGGLLTGRTWDRFVRLVAPDGDVNNGNPGIGPISRRVTKVTRRDHELRSPRDSDGNEKQPPTRLAIMDGAVKSIATAALPTDNLRPDLMHQGIDDLALELPSARPKPRHLPVVKDPQAGLWRDRIDYNRYWYAPEFEVVQPAPNANPEESPFCFLYGRTGVTETGDPALVARVHFTLRKRQSDATIDAMNALENLGEFLSHQADKGDIWAGPPEFDRVPTENLQVMLLIPFVDQNDGQRKHQRCTAETVHDRGSVVTATVRLHNDWVRLAYGALAVADFQAEPARVEVRYTFDTYAALEPTGGQKTLETNLHLAFGGKQFGTPVHYAPDAAKRTADYGSQHVQGRSYLDAANLTINQPGLEIRLQPEARRRPIGGIGGGTGLNGGGGGPIIVDPVPNPIPDPVPDPDPKPKPDDAGTIIPTKPDKIIIPDWEDEMNQVRYAKKGRAQEHTAELLFPCDRLGNFYRQQGEGQDNAIGCRDALQLGEIDYRQYAEIEDLRAESHRVYRSLAQSEQFLVVPTRYCISRRAADADNAYRPTIVLYATLDPANPANSRVHLDVTLQPDLTPHQRRSLRTALGDYARSPTIRYPTELSVARREESLLVDSAIDFTVNTTGPFIMIGMQTDLPGWQILLRRLENSGVHGEIAFQLDDGTAFDVNLLLRLNAIHGPWETGPIAVAQSADAIRLTNNIEQQVDVHDLVLYDRGTEVAQVAVETDLAPGATQSVTVAEEFDEIYPLYTVAAAGPTAITEIRSFVEDIYQTVAFVNQVNFDNHDLSRLEVQAHIKEMERTETVQLTQSMPVAEMEFVLPLTTYLDNHRLIYRVTKIQKSGDRSTTGWFQINLDTSSIVSLTWESLGD